MLLEYRYVDSYIKLMLGNFQIETQTAQHIAKNAPEKGDLFIIISMLLCCLVTLLLFYSTPLTIYGAVFVAVLLTAIFLIPTVILRSRRRKAQTKKLEQERNEQLNQHRESTSIGR